MGGIGRSGKQHSPHELLLGPVFLNRQDKYLDDTVTGLHQLLCLNRFHRILRIFGPLLQRGGVHRNILVAETRKDKRIA